MSVYPARIPPSRTGCQKWCSAKYEGAKAKVQACGAYASDNSATLKTAALILLGLGAIIGGSFALDHASHLGGHGFSAIGAGLEKIGYETLGVTSILGGLALFAIAATKAKRSFGDYPRAESFSSTRSEGKDRDKEPVDLSRSYSSLGGDGDID